MTRRSALDLAVLLWIVVWVWMAVTVAQDLRGLRHLTDTVTAVGHAAVDTAGALRSIERIPGFGQQFTGSAASIEKAGRRAIRSARQSRSSVNRTSVLLALSIGLIPTSTVLFIYVPRRVAAIRTAGPARRHDGQAH